MFKQTSIEEKMLQYIERELCRLHELADSFGWDKEDKGEIDPFIKVMNEISKLNAKMISILEKNKNEKI